MNSGNQTVENSCLIEYINQTALYFNSPFTVITVVLILPYFIHRLRVSYGKLNCVGNGFERKKDQRIKILVLKFIIIILSIEFSSNLCGMLSGIVYGFVPVFDKNNISPLNNCGINEEVDFLMQLFPRGWFAYLPTMLHISIVQFLQPTVSLLLNVLRRAYLDRPYRIIIKRWLCILLIRGCVFITLQIFYQTIYISFLMLPIFYIIDFKVYFTHSRRFHSLLKSRMEIARLHSCREEYRDKSMVFLQYRKTSSYTTLVFSILTLKFVISGIRFAIHGSTRINCTIFFLTLRYFPSITYSSVIRHALNKIVYCLFIGIHCLDFLYQILISFAYLLVCIGVVVCFYQRRKKFKQVNKTIGPLVTEYRRSFS